MSLRAELLRRYEVSAREHEEAGNFDFDCRRCRRRVGADCGSDDLAGLCADCWVIVDTRLRGGDHGDQLALALEATQ